MPEFVYALHDFKSDQGDDLPFSTGDRIQVIEKDEEFGDGWWTGRSSEGKTGLFPKNYTSQPQQEQDNTIADLSRLVRKTEEHCVGSGRFGDVYKGKWVDKQPVSEQKLVAIKVIRPIGSQKDSSKAIRHLNREMVIWQGLSHDNIVPFLGVSYIFGRMPALISLWMENGQLDGYLSTHPDADRGRIAGGIASGLLYLHTRSPKITHGDVKTANTLVDNEGNPKLSDFGLSWMQSEDTLWMTTTVNARGSVRWMAPELLNGNTNIPTSESDVYAFAMTVLEILSGKIPYHQHRQDGAVLMAVTIRKELPNRPTPSEIVGSHFWHVEIEEVWTCLTRCWDHDPGKRPTMADVEALFRLGGVNEAVILVDAPRVILSHGHTEPVTSVTFSPNGDWIASGSEDQTVRVWNANTGGLISGPFRGHTGHVTSVLFTVDSKRIVSASYDKTVRLWDAVTGKPIFAPFKGHTEAVTTLALSPDGNWIASASQDLTVRVWNADGGEVRFVLFQSQKSHVVAVAFSLDGKQMASACSDNSVQVWDMGTGIASGARRVQTFSGPFKRSYRTPTTITFSRDSTQVAVGYLDMSVRIEDLSGRAHARFEGHRGVIRSVALSADGRKITSGCRDKMVRVWDVGTGKALFEPIEGHTDEVNSVAFSPDGKRVASGSADNTVGVWNAEPR